MDRLQVKIEIDRLNQEIEELKAEKARYREALKGEGVMEKNTQPETFLEHYWFNLGHQSNKIAQENNYLRAENARYREALLKIKIMTDDPYSILYHVAREALKEE